MHVILIFLKDYDEIFIFPLLNAKFILVSYSLLNIK